MTNIYEQPWLLLIVAGVAGLAIFVFGRLRPQGRRWWLWLFPLAIALAAFAFDYFVQTDGEQVRAVIAGMVKAVEKEDIHALERFISEDYSDSFHKSKAALLRRCESWLREPVIEKNVYRILSLDVNSPHAEAVFTVRVVFDPRSSVYEYSKIIFFKFRADFRKEGEKWLLIRAEVLEPADWRSMQTSLSEGMG